MITNTLLSVNPATEEVLGSVEITPKKEIERAVALAKAAENEWKKIGIHMRIQKLAPLLRVFSEHKEELALLITREMGKPITESRAEIDSGCDFFQWFLDHAESALAETVTKHDEREFHRVIYEPVGTAAVILPWNFPFDIFIWGVMTNLLAGNTVVVKHSELCPLTGKLLENLMQSANVPQGVFTEVYGAGETGSTLVQQPIDLIWFTGSSATGRSLYEYASTKMIKAVLEMGGSNPTIVFADVDIKTMGNIIAKKRFLNCGQSCSALKRLLVHESLYSAVSEVMVRYCEAHIVGNPEDATTTLGPLVSFRQAETLAAQVADAVSKGAIVLTGGDFVSDKSRAYYQPTVLTNVTPYMRVWHEEVFGPVLPIVSFKSDDEAVKLAEDTEYGLGAQIYSVDTERAARVASQLKVGYVEINGISRRIPCNPFGGCKASGVGREHGVYGFREVSEIKAISMPA